MRGLLKLLWCALRGHPYPHAPDAAEYEDWALGYGPLPLDLYCPNCSALIKENK